MGVTGLETIAVSSLGGNELTHSGESERAKSGALSNTGVEVQRDLQLIIAQWPTLPQIIRSSIVAMVAALDDHSMSDEQKERRN